MLGFSTAIRRISDAVDRVIVTIVGILIGLLTLTVLLTITFRFIIHLPLAWSEDMSRALMVWISFLGASTALKHGLHIAFTSLVDALPPKLKKVVSILASLFVLAFLGASFWLGLISSINQWTQTATYFEIPMTFLYSAVPVGMGVMAIHVLAGIFISLSGAVSSAADRERNSLTGDAAVFGGKEQERRRES